MSIQSIINGAKDAQFVTSRIKIRGGLFNKGLPNYLPRLIYCVRKTVERQFGLDPNDDTLTVTANYLKAISVLYWLPQSGLVGVGGGGVAPVTPGNLSPQPYDFEVTGSSFIIGGQSAKTINAFIGYNVTFNRNNIPQSTVDMGGSYYSWNPNSGLFVCYPAAIEGELFTITAV